MAVNGIEIEVGQVWRTRGGDLARVEAARDSTLWPWLMRSGTHSYSVDHTGFQGNPESETARDLIELVPATKPHPFADLIKEVPPAGYIDPRIDLLDEQATNERHAAMLEASANEIQVGGDHYKTAEIQPWDYIVANGIGFLAGNVIKYVTRFDKKNGVEDLKKARHYLDKLIETEQAK